ncbi:MAG: XRE family transcriptional regulator [Eubacteriales bacterium]|nr:XRE family transcriptional regulator [Eubacteriales bacterium]
MATFGERLKELRKSNHLTQQTLAEMLNVDRTTVVKWESDKNLANQDILDFLCDKFGVTLDYLLGRNNILIKNNWINVYGSIAAGIPLEAIVDITDREEITEEMAKSGEYFALSIKGNSMSPRIQDGDVVILKKQEKVENGEIAAVLVNGNEATLKKIKILDNGLALIPLNPEYETMFYTSEQVANLPIRIIGKLVELRAKF